MKVISQYNCTSEDREYSSFICELNKNIVLKLEILGSDECKVTMQDKVSGIVDIDATISNEDVKALIRTLRNISVEMDRVKIKNTKI